MGEIKKTGGLILSAGMSSRMKAYKPLIEIAGKKMIRWSIEHMIAGEAEKIVVVTGYNHELLEAYLQSENWDAQVVPVYNEQYENQNMFDSVTCGLRELVDCEHISFSLADMPCISPDTYRLLAEKLDESGLDIAIPICEKRRRHPPLFRQKVAEEILAFNGEGGLRAFWLQAAPRILNLEVTDPGCAIDADYLDDLQVVEDYLRKHE